MDYLPSGSDKILLCQLCNSSESKYTCPRCEKSYCTSKCYKSEIHLNCSEEFFKESVESELKLKINDPNDTIKMINILKRHQQSLNDDNKDCNNLDNINFDESCDDSDDDSDDDDQVINLSDRIKNIDINNPNDVWAVLTDAERQEFQAIIYNKETDKLLPEWVPWWSQNNKKLVGDIDDTLYYKKNCPGLIDILPINGIDKASPLLSHNLVNIIGAYIVMVLHYNGEHQESFRESTIIFLTLNDIIGGDKIFNNDKLAVQAVIEKSIECNVLSEDFQTDLTTDYINKIIKGPTKNKTYYVKALLSDLYVLIDKFKSDSKDPTKLYSGDYSGTSLPKKFIVINKFDYSKLTNKFFKLCLKKIQYYLAWIDTFGTHFTSQF